MKSVADAERRFRELLVKLDCALSKKPKEICEKDIKLRSLSFIRSREFGLSNGETVRYNSCSDAIYLSYSIKKSAERDRTSERWRKIMFSNWVTELTRLFYRMKWGSS